MQKELARIANPVFVLYAPRNPGFPRHNYQACADTIFYMWAFSMMDLYAHLQDVAVSSKLPPKDSISLALK